MAFLGGQRIFQLFTLKPYKKERLDCLSRRVLFRRCHCLRYTHFYSLRPNHTESANVPFFILLSFTFHGNFEALLHTTLFRVEESGTGHGTWILPSQLNSCVTHSLIRIFFFLIILLLNDACFDLCASFGSIVMVFFYRFYLYPIVVITMLTHIQTLFASHAYT